MQVRVSAGSVSLALAVIAAGVPGVKLVADARPMHADIVHVYHRYLEEKDTVSAELERWLAKYGPKGPKNGWIPVTESRSNLDELEDQRQRFYLTKQQIAKVQKANPDAVFGTDGPFTLMTVQEYRSIYSNPHVTDAKRSKTPEPTTKTRKTKSSTSATNDAETTTAHSTTTKPRRNNSPSTNSSNDAKKTQTPSTEREAAHRRLDRKTSNDDGKTEKPQRTDEGNHNSNTDANKHGSNNNEDYNFKDVSSTDSDQVASVNGGTPNSDGSTPPFGSGSNQWGNGWGHGPYNAENWGWGAPSWSGSGGPQFDPSSPGSSGTYNAERSAASGSNAQPPVSYGDGSAPASSGSGFQPPGSNFQPPGSFGSSFQPPPYPTGSSSHPGWPGPTGSYPGWPAPTGSYPGWPSPSGSMSYPDWPSPSGSSGFQPPSPDTPGDGSVNEDPGDNDAPVPAPEPDTEAPAAPSPAPAPDPPAPTTRAPRTKAPSTNTPSTKKPSNEDSTDGARTTGSSTGNSVDWTTSGCISTPSEQGQCGSCWAFATIGAVEAGQCIASGDKSPPDLSEQQLVSCDTKDLGCNGGVPAYALQYMQDNGVCTEDSYPYTSIEGSPPQCSSSCSPTKPGIKNVVTIPTGDEDALISALKKQPVVVAVTSDNAVWKQYMGGIMSSCDSATVDHAVLVVGYDDKSFKIKNSWGTEWGEKGFVRIARGSNGGAGVCGVLTDMSYPEM